MTTQQAKLDAKCRLAWEGITYKKIRAKTVSFEGFGYGKAIFIDIYDAIVPTPDHWKRATQTIPKPSNGGYILKIR